MNYFSFVQLNSSRHPSTAADERGGGDSLRSYPLPMQLPRNYGFWQGPRATYTQRPIAEESSSPRRGWIPPRFLMLVLFVVGVSVCVSSGFALFMEYQNSCPPDENSTSEDNSEELGTVQMSPVQGDAPSDEEDTSPCASATCHLAHII